MSTKQKRVNHFVDLVYSIAAITICLLGGYGTYHLVGGLPASLYGMLIFTVLLQVRIISAERVTNSIHWFLKNMAVFFIPAGVGLVQHLALMKEFGLELIILTCLTTAGLLVFVGKLMQHRINAKTKEGAAESYE